MKVTSFQLATFGRLKCISPYVQVCSARVWGFSVQSLVEKHPLIKCGLPAALILASSPTAWAVAVPSILNTLSDY